ncbi:MAG: GlsB/YeaQ/YmgE family stress response membrane protein, partial [Desulfobacterales bacterium]
MGFITWIILGLIVGVIAKFVMPGKDPGGIFITI